MKKQKRKIQDLEVVLDFGMVSDRGRDIDRERDRDDSGFDGTFDAEKDQVFNF